MVAIASLKWSQSDTISSHNKLDTSQSLEFKELHTTLATLSSEITD